MTHRLTTNCAKNYYNRTLIVKVILENVVTCFLLGHSVFHCIILCYRYGSVSDQLGPSAFNKFDFDLIYFIFCGIM